MQSNISPPANELPWRQTAEGVVLVGGSCEACNVKFFPGKPFCPACGMGGVGSTDLSRLGRLYSFSTIHTAPTQFKAPYTVGFVDLDDNVRVFGQIEEDPKMLVIGELVEPVIGVIRQEGEVSVRSYKFRRLQR